MVLAGMSVVNTFNDIFLAYGQSDEFSFVFKKDTKIYNRRAEKILTCINNITYIDIVSTFTSSYVYNWSKVFVDKELKYAPTFDGRIILYPSLQNLKDYMSWRQVDCHINNLYNTTFWALVLIGKLTREEAHGRLKGTFSKDKNEILYKDFNINYNNIEDIYKKGTIIYRKVLSGNVANNKHENMMIDEGEELKVDLLKENILQTDKMVLQNELFYSRLFEFYKQGVFLCHTDVIKDDFWVRFDLEKY
jgi:tRNA(His) guanylyltransferase